MTFDFARCASLPYMVPYISDPVPGYNWNPNGFWLPFTAPSQIDASHSMNYVPCVIGTGQYSSTVSPTRSQGGTFLTEYFANLARWSIVATGTASPHIAGPGDPVSTGFVLSTNGTLGSVSGAICALGGPVPNSFSYATLFNTLVVGANPLDALHIWAQNNAGVTLKTRYYNGIAEICDAAGTWHYLATIGGLGVPSECWVECHDNGGSHTVKLYGGCQLYGQYTGVLPTGGLSNNSVAILQQSGANANRVSIVNELNMGPTQLPDDMTVCTNAFATAGLLSPANGHAMVLFEDVSRDVTPGTNFHLYLTKQNIGSWVEVPLIDAGVVGKGELDVTADVRRFVGDVPFPVGSGASMRAYISSSDGCFPVLQGLAVFWD